MGSTLCIAGLELLAGPREMADRTRSGGVVRLWEGHAALLVGIQYFSEALGQVRLEMPALHPLEPGSPETFPEYWGRGEGVLRHLREVADRRSAELTELADELVHQMETGLHDSFVPSGAGTPEPPELTFEERLNFPELGLATQAGRIIDTLSSSEPAKARALLPLWETSLRSRIQGIETECSMGAALIQHHMHNAASRAVLHHRAPGEAADALVPEHIIYTGSTELHTVTGQCYATKRRYRAACRAQCPGLSYVLGVVRGQSPRPASDEKALKQEWDFIRGALGLAKVARLHHEWRSEKDPM